MLSLKSTSSDRWLRQVDEHLDEILLDHAHCEKKAAGTAMNLMFAYVEDEELCREMTRIVNEELEHFHLVLEQLHRRGVRFRRLRPSNYGSQLHALIRKLEPGRAVDRLLVAALIEARSCERFDLLRNHVSDKDLAAFFGSLFESEAGHHSAYVRLAGHFADRATVRQRLEELQQSRKPRLLPVVTICHAYTVDCLAPCATILLRWSSGCFGDHRFGRESLESVEGFTRHRDPDPFSCLWPPKTAGAGMLVNRRVS